MKFELILIIGLLFYLWVFIFRDKKLKKEEVNEMLKSDKTFFEYRMKKLPKNIP